MKTQLQSVKAINIMELSKTELYCKKATREEVFNLFTTISKALIKQKKITDNSTSRFLNTNFANKKQYDSLYAKQYNDLRMYNLYLEDLKIIVKYL